MGPGGSLRALPQPPDEHRPQHTILLAVDQQLGQGAALRVAPELADPVGALEVGEAENVEKFGASRRRESLEASPEPSLNLLESHEGTLVPLDDSSRRSQGLCRHFGRFAPWLADLSPLAAIGSPSCAQDLAALLGQVRCASADN